MPHVALRAGIRVFMVAMVAVGALVARQRVIHAMRHDWRGIFQVLETKVVIQKPANLFELLEQL